MINNPELVCIARCKDEIHIIKEWVESMPFVDLFCIVDNGSTDGTLEYLKSINNVVVVQTRGLHEGRDCSLALNVALAHNPKWVLKMDCDEIFDDNAKKNFHKILRQNKFDSFFFRMYTFDYRLKSFFRNYINALKGLFFINMSSNKSINLSGMYLFYIISLLAVPMGFATRLLYSHTVSVEEFGLIYVMINFFALQLIIANSGSQPSLFHFVPKLLAQGKKVQSKNLCYYAFVIRLFSVLILAVISFIFSDFLAQHYFKTPSSIIVLNTFLVYFVMSVLVGVIPNILSSHKLQVQGKLLSSLQLFLILFFSGLFYFIQSQNLVVYYSLSWGIAAFVSFCVGVFYLFKKLPYLRSWPTWDKELFKKYISYALINIGNQIGAKVLKNIDVLIITLFLTVSQIRQFFE